MLKFRRSRFDARTQPNSTHMVFRRIVPSVFRMQHFYKGLIQLTTI